jgi:[acyl-carrier-protein] S-malonyltransferase
MLVAGLACYLAWREAGGPEPEAVAGHSLGEYTALTAAGSFKVDDAVRLVRLRAQAMQEAVPVGVGAMAAILGLEATVVAQGCAEAAAATGEVVSPANFNDPRQVVIAGTKAGVEKACEILKGLGAKRTLPLPVSAPFHCALMKPAAERLRERLASVPLHAPQFDVINNIDVAAPRDPQAIREALYRQAFGPVRWVETVMALRALGVSAIVECGPGKVLAGLVKRIDSEVNTTTLADPASLQQVKEMLA